MSKKRPKASKPSVGDLVKARVILEQAWVYEQRIERGLPWSAIRAHALRPDKLGGIGRNLSVSALRSMVAAHRAEQGEIVGTRDERIERRQLEYDTLALLARGTITGEVFEPDLSIFEPDPEDSTRTAIEKARAKADIESRVKIAAAKMRGDAAKLLLDVRAAEAKMHGDDAALRIEADVTTHDAVLDELNAALVAMGEEPVKAVES